MEIIRAYTIVMHTIRDLKDRSCYIALRYCLYIYTYMYADRHEIPCSTGIMGQLNHTFNMIHYTIYKVYNIHSIQNNVVW